MLTTGCTVPFAHSRHLNARRDGGLLKGSETTLAQHVSDSACVPLVPFSAASLSPAQRGTLVTSHSSRAHPVEFRSMGSCYKKEILEFHSPTNSAWTPASCLH